MKLASSLVIALGIMFGGYFIGNGVIQFKKLDRLVEVKGLAEKIVESDEARWMLNYNLSSNDMADLNKKIMQTNDEITKFLLAQGFDINEIEKMAGNITDKEALEYSDRKGLRYVVRGGFVISSKKVSKLIEASQRSDELLSRGVVLSGSQISYYFTKLNEIKPAMLEEAIKNAKEAANSFAKTADASLGDIKYASQGLFSISSPISEYESESSFRKRIRVVSQVSFYLK